MLNYSQPILNQNTWGMHINSARYLAPPPECPDWLTPLQRQEWQHRGVVVWDANKQVVTHLYASCALKVLENLRGTDAWKTSCFIVCSPAYQIPIPTTRRKKQIEETSIEMPKEG